MESVYVQRTNQLIEYMKLHLISLEQDLEEYYSEDDGGYLPQHLLSVVEDIMVS